MKNLHLGGARDLWRSLAPTTDCCPMKKVLYADEVEKILSEVHFQHMAFERPWDNWVSLVMSRTRRYSKITCTVKAPVISWIQRSPCSACATVRCFLIVLPTALHKQGAMFSRDFPCTQRSVQNKALFPSPSSMKIEVENNCSTGPSVTLGRWSHDRVPSVRLSHNHLMRSA